MASMIQSPAKRKQWAAALGAAVAAHLALGMILALSWPSIRGDLETLPESAAQPEPDSPVKPEDAVPPLEELRGQIQTSVDRYSGGDQQGLVQRGEEAAHWLERSSSEEAIDEIGEVVRNAYGAPARAYAPVDPPPPGDFDHDTMLPYAVRQTTGDDASTYVVYTWVDEQGRAMEIEMPEEASDRALTAALKMAQRSPMMRHLFQTSVLPVLESQLRQRP